MSETDALLQGDEDSKNDKVLFTTQSSSLSLEEIEGKSLVRYSRKQGAKDGWCWRVTRNYTEVCCPSLAAGSVEEPDWSLVAGESWIERLSQLQCLVRHSDEVFDWREHGELLKLVWDIKFPDIPLDVSGDKKWKQEKWKDFGFQGQDPCTDLRSNNVLDLECVLHLFSRYGELGEAMRKEGLLCAATCVNMVQILFIHLRIPLAQPGNDKLHRMIDPSIPTSAKLRKDVRSFWDLRESAYRAVQLSAMKSFLNILEKCATEEAIIFAFSSLVTTGVFLCLRGWREVTEKKDRQPTLLDFPLILYSARIRLMYLIACSPRSVRDVDVWAHELQEVLVDPAHGPP